MTEAEARRTLVDAGRRLLAEGLVARSWGNLSIRLNSETMVITPSGIPYLELKEEMIVLVDLQTGDWSGPWKPSGERKVHREIYLRRPDVEAIVHTHQNAGSACAAARITVTCPWGETPCAAYGLPGTKALSKATAKALGNGPAVLMANHGAFTVGNNLNQAFERIKTLETACAELLATKAGAPLPARADALWDSSLLTPLSLADGYPVLVSSAPFTSSWAKRGKPLKATLDDLAQLVGPKAPVASSLPDRRPKTDALFVKEVGLIVCGSDAEAVAMVVEKAARAAIGGEALGGAVAIPGWEARLMRWVYKNSYAKLAAKSKKANAG